MLVVGGPCSRGLAMEICRILNGEFVEVFRKKFPDGEIYIRLSREVEDEDVLVVQSTPSNDDLVSLILIADACRDAKKLRMIIPYFGYARQDRKFESGEAVSARAFAGILDANEVITVNLHSPKIVEYFKVPCIHLDASPLLGEYALKICNDPVFIAPDEGGIQRARNAARGGEWSFLKKERISSHEVRIKDVEVDVRGREVILIDDIISTGGTIAEAAKFLLSKGASEVHAFCVHAVLVEGSLERMLGSGIKSVVATNTIERDVSRVSVANLISQSIKSPSSSGGSS